MAVDLNSMTVSSLCYCFFEGVGTGFFFSGRKKCNNNKQQQDHGRTCIFVSTQLHYFLYLYLQHLYFLFFLLCAQNSFELVLCCHAPPSRTTLCTVEQKTPALWFLFPSRIAYCFYLDIFRFSILLCFFSKQFFLQFHFALCANISINCPIVQKKTVPSTTMSTQSVESANASENQIRIRIGIGIEKPKVNLK